MIVHLFWIWLRLRKRDEIAPCVVTLGGGSERDGAVELRNKRTARHPLGFGKQVVEFAPDKTGDASHGFDVFACHLEHEFCPCSCAAIVEGDYM